MMQPDSTIVELIHKVDSLELVIETIKHNPKIELFNLLKSILLILLGAFITYLFSQRKTKDDLKTKRETIFGDLRNQKEILIRMQSHLEHLKTKFLTEESFYHDSDVFQDLQTDIYESIPKTDLFIIFKKDIFQIVDIYKSINHLKVYSVERIYSDYRLKMKKLNKKLDQKAIPDDVYKDNRKIYVDTAVRQIYANLNTIIGLYVQINNILGIKEKLPVN